MRLTLPMRIVSYNVQNLFLAAQCGKAADEPGARVNAAKAPEAVKALAGMLQALKADVVLMQEVGSLAALEAVNDILANPYPFLAVPESNSDRGIHLALLSREPFTLASHRHVELIDAAGAPVLEYVSEADAEAGLAQPARLQRDLMLAELDLDGRERLALFNVHLKSKTNRSWRQVAADDLRAAEARFVARRISDYLAEHPERPCLLGGDFNDTRHSDALAPIFALPLADPMGVKLAASGRNPSTYWPKRRMRLDFLLLGRAAERLYRDDSARIHTGARAKRASDHYPVSLELDLKRLAF